MYQGLTIYLLIAIGWHGGEELAHLNPDHIGSIVGFMVVGFVTNIVDRHPRLHDPPRRDDGCGGSTRRRSPATTARTRPARS